MNIALLIPLAGMATGLIIMVNIFRLAHRYMDQRQAEARGGQDDTELRAEVEALRNHVEALEERLDFAERLLAQRTGRVQIPPES